MNIHEYQAKAVLKEFGVPVPRGKAVVSAEEAEAAAKELGGPVGKEVSRLYIEEGSDIASEFYLSALVDRSTSRVAFVVSTEGGMDIEAVAKTDPDKIVTFAVDPATGIMPHHCRRMAEVLGLSGDLVKQAGSLLPELYEAFVAKDMSLLEINPLVVTKVGQLICLDAKIGFDDNALY